LYQKSKKKDLGLNEFYLADMMLNVKHIRSLPKVIRPLKMKDLKKYFIDLSTKLFNKVRPKK